MRHDPRLLNIIEHSYCYPAEKTWKVLEDAVHEINNHNASGLSFEELYRSDPFADKPLAPHTNLN